MGSQGQGQAGLGPMCGKRLMAARVLRLGLQKPDSSRRLSEGRQCCVGSFGEPQVPSLSVPLGGPAMGGTKGPQMSAVVQANAGGETAQFSTFLIP